MKRWKTRSEAQRNMIKREKEIEQEKKKERIQNVDKRNSMVSRQRRSIDSKYM